MGKDLYLGAVFVAAIFLFHGTSCAPAKQTAPDDTKKPLGLLPISDDLTRNPWPETDEIKPDAPSSASEHTDISPLPSPSASNEIKTEATENSGANANKKDTKESSGTSETSTNPKPKESPQFDKDEKSKSTKEETDSHSGKAGNAKPENGPCSYVRCAPPPKGFECKETPREMTPQMHGLAGFCCAAHSCRREDGTSFIHYGVEYEEVSISPAQAASINNAHKFYPNMPAGSFFSNNAHAISPLVPIQSPSQFMPHFGGYPFSAGYGTGFGASRTSQFGSSPFVRPGFFSFNSPQFPSPQLAAASGRVGSSGASTSPVHTNFQGIYSESGAPYERLARSASFPGAQGSRFENNGAFQFAASDVWPRARRDVSNVDFPGMAPMGRDVEQFIP